MLGIRLTDGPRSKDSNQQPGMFDLLIEHLGNIMGTVLYPSEEGQIRNQDEKDQTIDLYTYDLETTDFAPKAEDSAKPKAEAEKSVLEYFSTAP